MIQRLSIRWKKWIAVLLYVAFYGQLLASLRVMGEERPVARYLRGSDIAGFAMDNVSERVADRDRQGMHATDTSGNSAGRERRVNVPHRSDIGGPNTPEASSFKTVGTDNLVNLFTGDFSYSIPLMDVGGYPVNIFYNGGISMEQEASWVGLGWNINPGSVSRSMRGVPDDFDGTDTLIQTQQVKPNKTWGGELSADAELLGIKAPISNLSLGFSYNNYLGPALDLGVGLSVSIPLIQTDLFEKAAKFDSSQGLSLSFGANAKLSSRSGFTLAPSINAILRSKSLMTDEGIGLTTSYNSRSGIQSLSLYSQVSAFAYLAKDTKGSGAAHEQNKPTTLVTGNLTTTTITFARPSYVPTLRMPMKNTYSSGQIELGGGMFGFRGAATAQGYYTVSKVDDSSVTIRKPAVGYLYLQNAVGRKDAVMDFNRVNDGPVTPNTPIISAPQYDYDIFTIQGEGTGGTIRAYRTGLGFMKDHLTVSKDNSLSLGADVAPPGHYGFNWNTVTAPSSAGNWDDDNNTLNRTLQFTGNQPGDSTEHVYFRNPGEMTVTNPTLINQIGTDNLVRFLVDGPTNEPMLESKLEQFSKNTGTPMGQIRVDTVNSSPKPRDKRTQVVTMLTASDASRVGLEDSLRSYQNTLDGNNNLTYASIPRVGSYRKGHHISEITVLESSGMRYVYGLPVYNTQQQDFTFSVRQPGSYNSNLANYNTDETGIASQEITGDNGIDGYFNEQQMPAYASSFLITGLLSPDYVDVKGDGITEDDLGNAVKFDYALSSGLHQWRTPRVAGTTGGNVAHFNAGLKSEVRDDKASISYGTREAWYLHAIESKSLIAIFSTSARNDAKGVRSALNGIAAGTENVNLKLDSISLYTKADIKAFGLPGAVPIKTVHFDYSYALCPGTPDDSASSGKLTLNDIYFTFNGQSRVSKDMYVFNYGNTGSAFDNAPYAPNASDKWGVYKPVTDSMSNPVNPGSLNNIDYPYTSQTKAMDDQYAGEWSLKKILLPSGGQIEVSYEADDYAYVQDRRACNMYPIYGFGMSTDYTNSNLLYTVYGADQNYVYVQLPNPLQNTDPVKAKQEIYAKYLQTLNQLAFKLNIYMPHGAETLTAYDSIADYGLCTNDKTGTMIYLSLKPVNGGGALANASVQFLINNLPGQAFPGYDLSGVSGLTAFFDLIGDALGSFFSAFSNAVQQMRSSGYGSSVSLATSFVRLASPTFFKYGGGHRVKRLILKDNWNVMTKQYASQYGQDYDYTTTQDVNGVPMTISSGVASYEPGVGSEENPFREILPFQNKLPLASAQYGAIEMPVLEAFYPAPVIGYSKVTVRSINRNGTHGDSIVRSAIGKQVNEFYTAKDYPSSWTYTPMNSLDYHKAPPITLFDRETIDRRTISQGFLVETNDMHGKIKAQSVYSESDENTALSYTRHYYKNTGANSLHDVVNFVDHTQAGAVTTGNMGVDMELMTDVREFSVVSQGQNGQVQVDFFSYVPPSFAVIPLVLPSLVENTYKAVTTTKLINYHAIEDSVIVSDKGSLVKTTTLAYDAETGMPVVTQTGNEFNDSIYNISYPAYWAYSGMGPAYSNIGMQFQNVAFNNGKIFSGVSNQRIFESGDELYISNSPSGQPDCVPASSPVPKLWVYDTSKNSTALTVPAANRSLLFIDSAGQPFTGSNVNLLLVRSGHRNDLGQAAASATAMVNPIRMFGGRLRLVVDDTDKVVSSAASTFREKWQVDGDVIPTTVMVPIPCGFAEVPSCGGTMPVHVNPYQRGLIGNFRANRNYVYYGARAETNPAVDTKLRHNGYIQGFGSFWNFNPSSNLVSDSTNSNWLWNTEVTRINSKGQELETHDALNRYTAAQYGFAKNFPVAVSQNAAYGQSFYAGFEDTHYSETLNNVAQDNCSNAKYVDFSNFTIIDTDTTSVKAHTGKFVVMVPGNSVDSVVVPVAPPDSLTYTLAFGDSLVKGPANPGIKYSLSPSYPDSVYQSSPTVSMVGTSDSMLADIVPQNVQHRITPQWSAYLQIPAQGNYTFHISAVSHYANATSAAFFSVSHEVHINGITNSFRKDTIAVAPDMSSPQLASFEYTLSLCKGTYLITGLISDIFEGGAEPSGGATDQFLWGCTNCGTTLHDTIETTVCNATTAMKTDSAMFNSSFNLLPGQKMQFSGWVRQDCGTPCFITNYTHPTVSLRFPGATPSSIPLHAKGPIIEGWQRVDTFFTVPANATAAKLLLGSDTALKTYFDDIRIHPFNADMKTYVYDPQSLRLIAEMDENNYATFYNYDEEGQLVRVKKETVQGVKTIKETRTAKQKNITNVQ